MFTSLIGCCQELSNLNQGSGLGSDKEPSPKCDAEQPGVRQNEIVLAHRLSLHSRVPSPARADQPVREEQGQLPSPTLQRDRQQTQRSRSEHLSQAQPWCDDQGEGEHECEPAYNYGAGPVVVAKENENLSSKQYTKFWYCHHNCQDCGPWRSQITRCIGCEHERCGQCQEEIVVTRDPSPPRE